MAGGGGEDTGEVGGMFFKGVFELSAQIKTWIYERKAKVVYPVTVYMSLCPLLMYRVELLSYGGEV